MHDQYIVNDREVGPDYTEYPLSIMNAPIPPGAKLIYISLLTHAQSTGKNPGQHAIGKMVGLHEATVRKHLGELEKEHLITSTRGGLNQTNAYTIYLPSEKSIPIAHLKADYGEARPGKKVKITRTLQWQVWLRDDFTCQHCGVRDNLAVDHIHPESRGGMLHLDNLQTLCKRCNSKKGDR